MSKCVSPHGFVTRTYRTGDETEIAHLFNVVYENVAGFVPRTPEYWLWSCLSRPDVESEGIVIVTENEKIIGYGVAGKTGNVWELCYDPSYDGNETISIILKWITDYVEVAGADSIVLTAPINDNIVRNLCSKLGFAETESELAFVNVVDLPKFMYELLNLRKEKLFGYNEEILIKLRNSPSWQVQNFTITLKNANISVKEGLTDNPSITLNADPPTIVSCILGTQGLLKSFLYSRLKVKPILKTSKIMKLLSILKINDLWFGPKSDFG